MKLLWAAFERVIYLFDSPVFLRRAVTSLGTTGVGTRTLSPSNFPVNLRRVFGTAIAAQSWSEQCFRRRCILESLDGASLASRSN